MAAVWVSFAVEGGAAVAVSATLAKWARKGFTLRSARHPQN